MSLKRALRRAAEKVGLQTDALNITERLMVEQLKHGRSSAVCREGDLALLWIHAEIGNEKASFAKGELAPRRRGDLALRNIDGKLHADHGQLRFAGENRGHLGDVSDAHAGNIELDIHRFGRNVLARADLGEVPRSQIHGELAAGDLSARDPLKHPAARLAGQEFRPKPLQHV